MVKITVVSDTHGARAEIQKLSRIIDESDYLIHAGDGIGDIAAFRGKKNENCITVCGNNDFGNAPYEVLTEIAGKKFFITHGHKYSVKRDLDRLKIAAYENQADVVIFGHTHMPLIENENGIIFINPGTMRHFFSVATYCYLLISEDKIYPKIVELR